MGLYSLVLGEYDQINQNLIVFTVIVLCPPYIKLAYYRKGVYNYDTLQKLDTKSTSQRDVAAKLARYTLTSWLARV